MFYVDSDDEENGGSGSNDKVVLRRKASLDEPEDELEERPVELRTALFEAMNLVSPIPRKRQISPAQLRRFYSQRRTTKLIQSFKVGLQKHAR